MSVKHILGHKDWYVITRDDAQPGRPRWHAGCRVLHGPNVEARAEWSLFRYNFGWGFRLGRNGGESDLGLDIHLGKLASLYLRIGSPWTKWANVKKERDPKGWYHARHYGFNLRAHKGNLVRIECGARANMSSKSDPWYREISLSWMHIVGRTTYENTIEDSGVVSIPLPEGNYVGTWRKERLVTRHRRFPGTLIDALRGTPHRIDYWLDIEGGIPHNGKGENSWDCGMDGLFGCGGRTLEDAVANAVKHTLRDRERYGPRKPLPRPMTVGEAEEWMKTA